LHNTCRAPQLTGNSVLPTELGVFGFLHLPRGDDTAKLRDEELSRGFPEARRGEHPSLETAHRMGWGQEVPADLEVVYLDLIGCRELQDLSLSSEVRRTVAITCGAHIDEAKVSVEHLRLQRAGWCIASFDSC
jgi:hypothetical protein